MPVTFKRKDPVEASSPLPAAAVHPLDKTITPPPATRAVGDEHTFTLKSRAKGKTEPGHTGEIYEYEGSNGARIAFYPSPTLEHCFGYDRDRTNGLGKAMLSPIVGAWRRAQAEGDPKGLELLKVR